MRALPLTPHLFAARAGPFLLLVLLGVSCVKPLPARRELTVERAPGFALSDSEGRSVTLAAVLAQGDAVLLFYRGHW